MDNIYTEEIIGAGFMWDNVEIMVIGWATGRLIVENTETKKVDEIAQSCFSEAAQKWGYEHAVI